MVKKAIVKKEANIIEIIEENKKLRETIEKLGTISSSDTNLARYMGEMDKIKQKARVETDKIQVHEIADHKNISLWTKLGKRIGPLHRDNALRIFQRFFDMGIMLSTDKPTLEEIEAHKQTDEYKKYADDLAKSRKRKEKSRKSGQMQKLAEEIAKMSGTTVEAINHVLKAHEIKPLVEGRK